MKIIEPSHVFQTPLNPFSADKILRALELAGRTCYKSEAAITEDSSADFVRKIIARGHESVLEHQSVTIRFICDRGVSHELVRHRLCTFSQESTRYCNYGGEKFGGEITVIRPPFWPQGSSSHALWVQAMETAETIYLSILKNGATPQEARSVLPNSLKTEIVVTANLREWRHILRLRTASAAHPQMRQLMRPLLEDFKHHLAPVFEDIPTP